MRKRILLKRKEALGDVLMTTPILRALRQKNPDAEIVFATKCPDLLYGNPNVDVIVEGSGGENYDEVYDLRYEDCPGEVLIDAMAEQAGVELDSRRMEIYLGHAVDMSFRPKDPYAVFHTGASWPSKSWPIEKFETVAEELLLVGFQILQVGNAQTPLLFGNEVREGVFAYIGKPWRMVMTAIEQAKFFVGIDSAPSNVAKAVGTPAFVVYGCVDPNMMLADAEEYPIHLPELPCAGCRNRSTGAFIECPKPETYCLTGISPRMVLERIGDWYEKKRAKGIYKFIRWYPEPVQSDTSWETSKVLDKVRPYTDGMLGLDIACGREKLPGSIGIDIRTGVADVVADATAPIDELQMAIYLDTGEWHQDFDYIYSSHLIEDFTHGEQILMLQDWVTRLRPGGHLIIYVPEKGAYTDCNVSHKREFMHSDLENLMDDVGVQVVETYYENAIDPEKYGILAVGRKP